MNLISKLFRRNADERHKVGGMEDFMTLIRVYFQAAIASELGITNLAMLPDLRVFKTSLRVPTMNNRLGAGEKVRCKKMLKDMYAMNDDFFKEIDQSIRRRCHKLQDVQVYLVQFQDFTQDVMMLMGNLMKFKLRLPGFFKKALYAMTEKTVNSIYTKNNFTEPGVMKAVVAVREYSRRLGFSQRWVTDFVYTVVMLAKKEPQPQDDANGQKDKKL